MNKDEMIDEILKTLIRRSFYKDYGTIREFLLEIKDETVLGDILADLK